MKITFTRHGQSLANTLQIISNRDLPHPLTDLGRQQAEALSQTLSRTRFERIYTSPVPRAVETGQILSERLNSPLRIEPALREYDCGELEGRGDPEAWQIHQQFVQD
jgi:probable phosphoglycerate mutase